MIRRTALLAFASAFTLLLVACTGDADTADQATPAASETTAAASNSTPVAASDGDDAVDSGGYGASAEAPAATTPPAATPSPAAADARTSVIANFALETLAVDAGTTVTWRNEDGVPHTVTDSDGAFDSGSLSRGATFSHTFSAPGTFRYACSIHPSMVGTITVR